MALVLAHGVLLPERLRNNSFVLLSLYATRAPDSAPSFCFILVNIHPRPVSNRYPTPCTATIPTDPSPASFFLNRDTKTSTLRPTRTPSSAQTWRRISSRSSSLSGLDAKSRSSLVSRKVSGCETPPQTSI